MEKRRDRLKEITKKQIIKDNTHKVSVADKFGLFIIMTIIFTLVFKAIELSIFDLPVEVYLNNRIAFLQKWIELAIMASAIITMLYAIINDYGKVSSKLSISSGNFDVLKLKIVSIKKDADYYKSRNYIVAFSEYGITKVVHENIINEYSIGKEFYIPVKLDENDIIKVYKIYDATTHIVKTYEDVKIEHNTIRISGDDIV